MHSSMSNEARAWHFKAFDAVKQFIVGQSDSDSNYDGSQSEFDHLHSNLHYHTMKQEIERLTQHNRELSRSLNLLLEENEAEFFKSQDRERKVKLQYQASLRKLKQELTDSNEKLTELETENKELRKNYQDSQTKLQECQTSLKSVETNCNQLKSNLEALTATRKEKDTKTAELIAELQKENQKLISEKNRLQFALQHVSENLTKTESEIMSYDDEFVSYELEAPLKDLVKEIEENIRTLQRDKIAQKSVYITECHNLEAQFENYKTSLDSQYKSLLYQRANSDQYLRIVSHEKKELEASVKKLLCEVNECQEAIKQEKRQNTDLQAQNLMLLASLEEQKKLVEELQKKSLKAESDEFEILQ